MEKTQTPPKKKPFNNTTTQNHHSNTKKWADLPKDVLHLIAYHLDFKTDLPRIRSVCPSWRSALPLADFPLREIHLEVPPLEYNNNKALVPLLGYAINTNKPIYLLKTRYYLFYPLPGSPCRGGWIARMGELGLNKWRLLSPLSSDSKFKRYLYTDPLIVGEINLLDFRVVELARPMSLVYDLDYNAQPISKKVVQGARAVLVLLDDELGLMLWRFGDHQWVKIEDQQQDHYVRFKDIEFHNGNFYAFRMTSISQFQVWVINPGNLSIMKQEIDVPGILQLNEGKYSCMDANFVPSKSNGCLHLTIDVEAREGKICRHKLVLMLREEKDEMKSKWERVENIGNMTFFIGSNVSFALPPPPRSLALWKPNSIYSFNTSGTVWLTRNNNIKLASWNPHCMSEGSECFRRMIYHTFKGHFNLFIMGENDDLVYPTYNDYFNLFIMNEYDKGGDEMSCEKRQELSTRLFFPPPSWVKWRCPSLNNIEIRLDV
ncbi:putative F-box protein At3g25750 [Chenopodium quinoa]|uniref:F-box domain-containing protein n=1 Tax=Chenopodium quinoa TaxID=63459 RepID=A0A803LY52_CHEQI|nr:putative F-box protein At3g25750 [Chenopodium quinoa]